MWAVLPSCPIQIVGWSKRNTQSQGVMSLSVNLNAFNTKTNKQTKKSSTRVFFSFGLFCLETSRSSVVLRQASIAHKKHCAATSWCRWQNDVWLICCCGWFPHLINRAQCSNNLSRSGLNRPTFSPHSLFFVYTAFWGFVQLFFPPTISLYIISIINFWCKLFWQCGKCRFFLLLL